MDWMKVIAKQLDLPPDEKAQVLEELTDHFELLRARLISDGMSAERAEKEAALSLGDPKTIASALRAVHIRAGWKSALLGGLPFLSMALFPVIMLWYGYGMPKTDAWRAGLIGDVALMVLLGVGMLCAAMCKIRHGCRDPWVATCAAVGMSLPVLAALGSPALAWALHMEHSGLAGTMADLAFSYGPLSSVAVVISASGISSRVSRVSMIIAAVAIASWISPLWVCRALGYSSYFYWLEVACRLPAFCCWLALLTLAGWRAFAYQAYGGAANWSLFGFSFFMSLAYPAVSGCIDLSTPQPPVIMGAGIMIAIISCVVFARCSDWNSKKLGLVPGILAVSFVSGCGQVRNVEYWIDFRIAAIIAALLTIVVLGVPSVYSVLASRKRPPATDHMLYGG